MEGGEGGIGKVQIDSPKSVTTAFLRFHPDIPKHKTPPLNQKWGPYIQLMVTSWLSVA
jgi:hypothetical protein